MRSPRETCLPGHDGTARGPNDDGCDFMETKSNGGSTKHDYLRKRAREAGFWEKERHRSLGGEKRNNNLGGKILPPD